LALSDAAEWLGDLHPLAEQLGSADGLVTLGSVSASLRLAPVHNLPSLRQFLRDYHSQVLLPFELPAIWHAHGHATRHEVRELVALDRRLVGEPVLRALRSQPAAASANTSCGSCAPCAMSAWCSATSMPSKATRRMAGTRWSMA
jgi:predicted metal-binding protein